MPRLPRTARRRAAAIHGAKILLTSASLVATIGGWAALSAGDSATEEVAQVVTVTEPATATRVVPTATYQAGSVVTDASLPAATVAPTATPVPTATAQPTAHVRIRTQSSR